MNSNADRRSIFESNIKEIIEHNTSGKHTWTKGINEYSDMTEEEFFEYFHIVNDE